MRKHEPVISGKLLDALQRREGFGLKARHLCHYALTAPELPCLLTLEELDDWWPLFLTINPKWSDAELRAAAVSLPDPPVLPERVKRRARAFIERFIAARLTNTLELSRKKLENSHRWVN